MMTWTPAEIGTFFNAFSDLWPGYFGESTSAGSKFGQWKETIQRFPSGIAIQALKDIFEEQEIPRAPTLKIFREVAHKIMVAMRSWQHQQRNGPGRASDGNPEMTGYDFAQETEVWEALFDRQETPEQLQLVKGFREVLRRGGNGPDIARIVGDVLTMRNGKGAAV